MERLAAEDLFESLEGEEEQSIIEFKKEDNPNLEHITKAFFASYKGILLKNSWSRDLDFYTCLECVPSYTAQDIFNFTYIFNDILEKNFKFPIPDTAGIFLSALSHKCTDETSHLPLHVISYSLSYIGFHNNGKHIIIQGNVGDDLGSQMSKGTIKLNGNTLASIGYGMTGGSIHLEGKYYLSDHYVKYIKKGEIYHKGKLILKDGKRV